MLNLFAHQPVFASRDTHSSVMFAGVGAGADTRIDG